MSGSAKRPAPWIDRRFPFDQPEEDHPRILAALRDAPDRVAGLVAGLSEAQLRWSPEPEVWSIAVHVGHLADLEDLWATRVAEFERGAAVLTAADMSNARTHAAGHETRSREDLLEDFARRRARLLEALASFVPARFGLVARHPRLDQPMRVLDLCSFVVAHDEHHLQTMRALVADAGRS